MRLSPAAMYDFATEALTGTDFYSIEGFYHSQSNSIGKRL